MKLKLFLYIIFIPLILGGCFDTQGVPPDYPFGQELWNFEDNGICRSDGYISVSYNIFTGSGFCGEKLLLENDTDIKLDCGIQVDLPGNTENQSCIECNRETNYFSDSYREENMNSTFPDRIGKLRIFIKPVNEPGGWNPTTTVYKDFDIAMPFKMSDPPESNNFAWSRALKIPIDPAWKFDDKDELTVYIRFAIERQDRLSQIYKCQYLGLLNWQCISWKAHKRDYKYIEQMITLKKNVSDCIEPAKLPYCSPLIYSTPNPTLTAVYVMTVSAYNTMVSVRDTQTATARLSYTPTPTFDSDEYIQGEINATKTAIAEQSEQTYLNATETMIQEVFESMRATQTEVVQATETALANATMTVTITDSDYFYVEYFPENANDFVKVHYMLYNAASEVKVQIKSGETVVLEKTDLSKAIGENIWTWDFKNNEGVIVKPWEYELVVFVNGLPIQSIEDTPCRIGVFNNNEFNVEFKTEKSSFAVECTPVDNSDVFRNPYPGPQHQSKYMGGFKSNFLGTDLYYPSRIKKIYYKDDNSLVLFNSENAEEVTVNSFMYLGYTTTSYSIAVQQLQRMLNIVLTSYRNYIGEGVFDYTRIKQDGLWGNDLNSAVEKYIQYRRIIKRDLAFGEYSNVTDDILHMYHNLGPLSPQLVTDYYRKYVVNSAFLEVLMEEAKIYDNITPFDPEYDGMAFRDSLFDLIDSLSADFSIRPESIEVNMFAAFLKAIIQKESYFIHMRSCGEITFSATKARGYGQLTDVAITDDRGKTKDYLEEPVGEKVYQSQINLGFTARFLAQMIDDTYYSFPSSTYNLDSFKRIKLAAAFYNTGMGYVVTNGFSIFKYLGIDTPAEFASSKYSNDVEKVVEAAITKMTNANKTTVSKVVGTRTYTIKLSKLQELRSYLNAIFINETRYLGDTSISYNGYYGYYLSNSDDTTFKNTYFGRIAN
ncbi:MAG: hypothetical protein CVV21_09475 [Candidatus Goldiibacteriota bacterium HGW-Goldbacteria-1]|jgi:hypothetical protein|nr:MAG: hypothetical protein CVV21_09475 [Candidatus Goldiibacteriota bacterium HGW-Goldbacteria-1]